MATLALKSSHKEQPSVIRLLWAKELSANAIQSKMRPVYGDMYFTRPTIRFWRKKFAHGRESVDEEESGCRVVSTPDATMIAIDSLMYDFLLVSHCNYSSILYHLRFI